MSRLQSNNPSFSNSFTSAQRSYVKNLDDPNQSYQGPITGFLNPGYQAASFSSSIDWLAQRLSPDSVLRNSLDVLRTRSQAIVRDNDFARNVIRIYRNRIIGNGIRLQSRVKKDEVLDKIVNEQIENLWKRWKKPKNCSVTGNISFDSLMRQIVNAMLIDGEVFIRLVKRKPHPKSIPLQLQLIPSEYCPLDVYPKISKAGNVWNLGIEFDEWKTPVNYAFYTQHPNDQNLNNPQVKQYLRTIPAKEIIHLKFYNETLPNTTRGVPILYSSILTLKDLFDYRSIEVTRAQVASAVMGFVSTTDENYQIEDGEDRNNLLQQRPMMAGSFYNLDPNSSVDIPHIQSPSGQYGAFIDSNGACVAAGSGVEYAALTADHSKSNYSSSRLAAITTEPTYKAMQQEIEDHFIDELYSRFIEFAVLKLKLPIDNRTLDDYCNYKVYWPNQKYIDPDKEIRANINAINAGIKSRSEVLAERGIDFHDHIETLKAEKDLLEEANLDFTTTPIGSQLPSQETPQEEENNAQSN